MLQKLNKCFNKPRYNFWDVGLWLGLLIIAQRTDSWFYIVGFAVLWFSASVILDKLDKPV